LEVINNPTNQGKREMMEEKQNTGEQTQEASVSINTAEITNANQSFVEKYFEHLKWTMVIYHIFFALWATFLFLQAILPSINKLVFALPLIFFIITSISGSIRLFKGKDNAYNYLIAAQIPQTIVLQLNGFIYYLLVGQWIILRLGGNTLLGIDFGLLDAKYMFLFGNANEINFLFGINILPVIVIAILLKMERIEEISEDEKNEE
jgi:hypothetical protein